MMKVLKQTLFAAAIVIGLAISVSAQKGGTPHKPKPPKIKAPKKTWPPKPKKPAMAMVVAGKIEETVTA